MMLLSSPTPPSPPSKWRVTPTQKATLLSAFSHSAYPSPARKASLAMQLGVTSAQVSKWFQHRREALARLGQFKAQYNRPRRTPEELDVLQTAFAADRYPNAQKLAELERRLQNVSAKQIKLWFKHRRRQLHKRTRNTTTTISSSQQTTPTQQINHLQIQHQQHHQQQQQQHQQQPPPQHVQSQEWWRGRVGLNGLEEMALRGAWAVTGGEMLPQDAMTRLAAVVAKPVEVVAAWWAAELGGVVEEQREGDGYAGYLYAATTAAAAANNPITAVRYPPWGLTAVQPTVPLQQQPHVPHPQTTPPSQVGMYGKGS